jgi:hypothetical protein
MSYLLEKAKDKVKKLEEELKDPDLKEHHKPLLEAQLLKEQAEVKKYEAMKDRDLDKWAVEMKAITGHINAVEDKYNCRTVKFMFAVADFFDKPRSISKSLAKNIREYTITKINAPVCSIAGSPKPELRPMPHHHGSVEERNLERQRIDREELMKFRDLSVSYLEAKPSRWDRIKAKIDAFKNA